MLNVKANALVRDQLHPEGYFVFPDSGDSGLAAGAAMEALFQMGMHKGQPALATPYLGHNSPEGDVQRVVDRYASHYQLRIVAASHNLVAQKIAEGKVVGTFQGRLEMGPRALGNRSVLADPRTVEVKDRINLLLKGREPFVPFAPAVLEEDAHLYWVGPIDYRYMTFAVTATDLARQIVPVVVHADGTMRPQVVSVTTNPWFYDLLTAFKAHTSIWVLVNTSFNRHGFPIVGEAADALEHLVNGWVDALYIGSLYVERA